MQILPGKFNTNCPRAMTDAEGNVTHFHAETGLDVYRGNTALVNWSES